MNQKTAVSKPLHYDRTDNATCLIYCGQDGQDVYISSDDDNQLAYSVNSFHRLMAGENVKPDIKFCDEISSKHSTLLIHPGQVFNTEGDVAKIAGLSDYRGIVTVSKSIGRINHVLEFAHFGQTNGRPSILLPLSLRAMLRVFGRLVPVELANTAIRLDIDHVLMGDDGKFTLGRLYMDNEGRLIRPETLTDFAFTPGSPYATFGDQYGHHRHYNQEGRVGGCTGSKYGTPGSIEPASRPMGFDVLLSDLLVSQIKETTASKKMGDDMIEIIKDQGHRAYVKVWGTQYCYSTDLYVRQLAPNKAEKKPQLLCGLDDKTIRSKFSEQIYVGSPDSFQTLDYKGWLSNNRREQTLGYAVFEINGLLDTECMDFKPWVLLPQTGAAVELELGQKAIEEQPLDQAEGTKSQTDPENPTAISEGGKIKTTREQFLQVSDQLDKFLSEHESGQATKFCVVIEGTLKDGPLSCEIKTYTTSGRKEL